MQMQREDISTDVFEWNWGKGLRQDLFEDIDVTFLTATLPVYG